MIVRGMRVEDVGVSGRLRRGRVRDGGRAANSSKQRIWAAVALEHPALGLSREGLADELVHAWVAVHEGDAEPGWESRD